MKERLTNINLKENYQNGSKETLRASEVADLDPYNVRGKPVQNVAKELLKEDVFAARGFSEQELIDLVVSEVGEWEKTLGTEVDLRILPEFVTPQVKKKIESLGMQLIYMPKLDLMEKGLEINEVDAYQFLLNGKYPFWRTLDSLTEDEIKDPHISRNLDKSFWKRVKNGELDFPNLSGQWIAVETFENRFKNNLNTFLGVPRVDVARTRVNLTIANDEFKLLEDYIGLPAGKSELRLPEALELNLIGNRFAENTNEGWEWTNTDIVGSKPAQSVIYNRSIATGLADEYSSGELLGWRGIIAFKNE